MVLNEVDLKVYVDHWRKESGGVEKSTPTVVNPAGIIHKPPAGWYCWAYTNNSDKFEQWMEKTCPTAEFQFRFNSGNPMYTVQIYNEKEALLFQIAWVT